jgi:hemolysin activation/secretion protein
MYASFSFDNRSSDPFSASAWAFALAGEVSDPGLHSDFDYSRFTASLRRYQKITHHSMLAVRGMMGGSSGDLPMHRAFYLGGLGTLHGYRHKELMGSRFWMLNVEYRQTIPRTDIAVALLWDVAKVGFNYNQWGDIEVTHSVGGAVYFGDDVRVSIARRLDGFSDREPRIFVRFEHVF